MRECSIFAVQLELLPSGDFSGPLFSAISDHLQLCANCRGRLELIKKMDAMIKNNMAEIPVPLFLKQKLTAKYAGENNEGQSFVIPDTLGQKLNWLADHSLKHHLRFVGENKQTNKKPQYAKPKIIASISVKNDVSYNKNDIPELNWNKCNLGDVEAEFIFFEDKGLAGSLYLLPDEAAHLKHWDGKKEIIQQGNYLVSIWKTGETVYSKVMKNEVPG